MYIRKGETRARNTFGPLVSFPLLKSIRVKRETLAASDSPPPASLQRAHDETRKQNGENVTHKWPERVGGLLKMGGERPRRACARKRAPKNITATPTSLHGENLLSVTC